VSRCPLAAHVRFSVGEQAALRGLKSESGEQMLVQQCRTNAQRPIACRQVDLPGRKGSHIRKRPVDRAKLEVLRRCDRELTTEERVVGGQVHDLLWFGVPERPQDYTVHNGENGGVGADAERNRQECDGREYWRAPECPQAVTYVTREVVQPRQAALITERLHRLGDAARVDPCRPLRAFGRMAPARRVLGGELQMQPQFLLEVAIIPACTEGSPEPPDPLA